MTERGYYKKGQILKIVVTGGAGFIGSNFIRMVLRERPGWKVVNLDSLTYAGNLESLADIADSRAYTFIKGDITSPADVEAAITPGTDAVINFAAETHVDKSLYEPARFLKANVLGTGVLLERAREISIPVFVQISTDEVYGSISGDAEAPEDAPLRPSSPYAASKAAADLLCLSFFKTHRLPVMITRSSNNYGPYQFPEKIIPFFISEASCGRALPIYGRGENIRNWLYVEDNCRAIMTALEKGTPGEVYNIGTDAYLDNLSLTKKILAALGCSGELIKFVIDRPGHDLRYAVDSAKIRRLGWKPRANFEDGLRDTIEWYLSHKAWWENILSGEHLNFYENHYRKR